MEIPCRQCPTFIRCKLRMIEAKGKIGRNHPVIHQGVQGIAIRENCISLAKYLYGPGSCPSGVNSVRELFSLHKIDYLRGGPKFPDLKHLAKRKD